MVISSMKISFFSMQVSEFSSHDMICDISNPRQIYISKVKIGEDNGQVGQMIANDFELVTDIPDIYQEILF